MKTCDVCCKMDPGSELDIWTFELKNSHGEVDQVAKFETCQECHTLVIHRLGWMLAQLKVDRA